MEITIHAATAGEELGSGDGKTFLAKIRDHERTDCLLKVRISFVEDGLRMISFIQDDLGFLAKPREQIVAQERDRESIQVSYLQMLDDVPVLGRNHYCPRLRRAK